MAASSTRYSLRLIAVSRLTCLKGGERNLVFALSKNVLLKERNPVKMCMFCNFV